MCNTVADTLDASFEEACNVDVVGPPMLSTLAAY